MVRASSAYYARGALLALALVVYTGAMRNERGPSGEREVTGEGSVSGEGGVTDKDGTSGAGGVASKAVIDASDSVGDYNSTESNTYIPKIVTGEIRWSEYNGNEYMELRCTDTDNTATALEDIRFPHFDDTSVNLSFMLCPLPRGSYTEVLTALHYRIANLKRLHLHLHNLQSTQLLQASHFAGLPVRSLRIIQNMRQAGLVPLDPIVFEPLLELTELAVSHVILLPMPASSRLQWVLAVNGKSLSAWGGCDQLKVLIFVGWEVHNSADVSSNWLANCTKLQRIGMSRLSTSSMAQVLLGAKTPRWLIIQETAPGPLDLIFSKINLTGLEFLELQNNQLKWIDTDIIPASLTALDLSGNELEYFPWLEPQQLRPSLRKLILDNNPLSTEQPICNQFAATDFCGAGAAPQATLQLLSLKNTGATRLCFGNWISLQQLDLRNNNITTLELLELTEPIGEYEWTAVDLRGNTIRSVPLNEEGYNTLLNKFNKSRVGVLVDLVLNCDCENAWLARALRSLPNLRVENDLLGPVRCSKGKRLVDTPAEQLECERFPCKGCVCRRAWSNNMTEAFCEPRMGLQFVPRVPGLRALHAASNTIETLYVNDLPKTLLILNVSENKISRLNESVVNQLFSVQERRVWFAGNPIDCNCGNRALLASLQQHRTQVADYFGIVCVGTKQTVDSVVTSELCDAGSGQVGVMAILVASGLLVALAALVAAVYCRYERPLRIFLYARGLCLCCVQEDNADNDRPFDAFVSFAHADESLVTEQLLPGLERGPHSYKLCVHFRDWQPGEMIPTQIRLSVERSRRTIIVLSRNFLQSLWGILEFRTAHESAISDGRVRVVVVVLDDVVDDEGLDAELRGYLRMHTYLRWGDPWFWDKLRYALPHRRISSTNNTHHPPPQPDIAPGCVNLSPDELLPLSAQSAVNLSPDELLPFSTPSDVNLSPYELLPFSAQSDVILSQNELQLDGAQGDVDLPPHE